MVAVDPRDATAAHCTATGPSSSTASAGASSFLPARGSAPFIRQYDSPDLQRLLQRLRRLERHRPLNARAAAATGAAAKPRGSGTPAGPNDVGIAAALPGLSPLPLVDEMWVCDAEGSPAVEQVNARWGRGREGPPSAVSPLAGDNLHILTWIGTTNASCKAQYSCPTFGSNSWHAMPCTKLTARVAPP